MVRSDNGNLTFSDFVGKRGSSRSGSELDGKGIRRTDHGLDRTSCVISLQLTDGFASGRKNIPDYPVGRRNRHRSERSPPGAHIPPPVR